MSQHVLFTFAACIYVVLAVVPETSERFFCQEGSQVLKLKNASRAVDCEQSWTAETIPIASFMADSAECHNPCINVTAGEITISDCVNVTLSVICYMGHVTEFRIHYESIQYSPLPLQINKSGRHHYGIYAFGVLLLVILVAFSIQRCISHCCRIQNTGPNQV